MSQTQFDIRFLLSQSQAGRGQIALGSFVEEFDSPLGFWMDADYKRQWKEGTSRLLAGAAKSALVTAIYDPGNANFLMWWVMYRDDGEIVFRNHILLMEHLPRPLDLNDLYSFVPERDRNRDSEYPVSEWVVPLESIANFTIGRRRPARPY